MIWSAFAAEAPELTRLGEERFDAAGLALDVEAASWIKSDGAGQLVIRWRAGEALRTSKRTWKGSGYGE